MAVGEVMIDGMFSKAAFDTCGLDTEQAAALAKQLEVAVQQELLPTLRDSYAHLVHGDAP
jgi:hypothetical protein